MKKEEFKNDWTKGLPFYAIGFKTSDNQFCIFRDDTEMGTFEYIKIDKEEATRLIERLKEFVNE